MKKTDFYITKGHPAPGNSIKYSFKLVHGYAATLAAPGGTQITVCFDRRGAWWYATEASTGTCIFAGSTRAELVARLTPEIIGDIATAIQHERSQAIARQLAAHISARRGSAMTYYQRRKEDARAQAQEWQRRVYSDLAAPITYGELVAAQDYFYRLGCRYGLIREYRTNGII